MDLISREAVKAKAQTVTEWTWQRGKFIGLADVDDIPSAFEGMTNGEVIQALFPNANYERCINFMHITSVNCCGLIFFWDWWNAPYQKGDTKDEKI